MAFLNKFLFLNRNYFAVWTLAAMLCAVTHRFEEFLAMFVEAFLVGKVIQCLMAAFAFKTSIRLYQGAPSEIIHGLFRLETLRQMGPRKGHMSPYPKDLIATGGVVCMILLGMWLWSRFVAFVWLSLLALIDVAAYLLGRLMPPVLLYLSASSKDSHHMWDLLLRYFYPLKVVSLLDNKARDSMGQYSDLDADTEVVLNSYRAITAHPWTDVAEFLIQRVPAILIDTRTVSPGLEFEVDVILRKDMLSKAIILTSNTPNETSLFSNLHERLPESERWRCVTEVTLTELLKVERRSFDQGSMAKVLYSSLHGQAQCRSWVPRLTRKNTYFCAIFIVTMVAYSMHGHNIVLSSFMASLCVAAGYLALATHGALVRKLIKRSAELSSASTDSQ